MNKKSVLIIGAFFLMSACGKKEDEKFLIQPCVVKVETLERKDIVKEISLTGTVRGFNEVKVFAKVSGKLSRKLKHEGDAAAKNEVLAYIDRDEPALDYSKAQIKAPIAGMVTQYNFSEGDTVSPAGAPVLEIADVRKVKVVFYLTQKEILEVRPGQKAVVCADYLPAPQKGYVLKIYPSADPLSRKFKGEVLVNNSKNLFKTNTFAAVKIETQRKNQVLALPRKALYEESGEKFVFIISSASTAEKRIVETGISDGYNIEITSGAQDGESVITEGSYLLKEGTPVIIEKP